jgi:tetraacyldisaccharide-1-P 4'-kinase
MGSSVHGGIRAAVAGYLEASVERGSGRGSRVGGALASAWGAFEAGRVSRPVSIPARAKVIGVGGATLGGSYKTPLSVAVAEAMARRGERVALVGHAYRGRVRFARAVSPSDDVAEVGDDALFAARRLSALGIPVFVGPTRQSAVDLAARSASWLVVDGLLQTRPERLSCSILGLDGRRPWGQGQCPPLGDLRAPPEALLHAADVTATVRDAQDPCAEGDRANPDPGAEGDRANPDPCAEGDPPNSALGEPLRWDVRGRLADAVDAAGRHVALAELASQRIGVLLTIARPERVMDALACRGLFAVRFVRFGDHDRPSRTELERIARGPGHRVDVWITTEKCATNLPASVAHAPILALRHELELPANLLRVVAARG